MELSLLDFTLNNFENYYNLKCEENNIFWTNHIEKPDKSNLLQWCSQQLLLKTRKILLAKLESTAEIVGYGYIDFKNEHEAEISYGISGHYVGKGLGKELVKQLIKHTCINFENINTVEAWVLENNISSQKCLISNGFYKTNNFKPIYFTPLECKIYMYNYQLIL